MRRQVLEVLVPAMADFSLDIVIGKGLSARDIRLKLPPFTVLGTTTNAMQMDKRLCSLMFMFSFSPYDTVEVGKIISSAAIQQGIDIESAAVSLLAEQSNGRPGEALLALRKAHKYAIAFTDGRITSTVAIDALAEFGSKSYSPGPERQLIPDDVKIFVWQRDGGQCVKCGAGKTWSMTTLSRSPKVAAILHAISSFSVRSAIGQRAPRSLEGLCA